MGSKLESMVCRLRRYGVTDSGQSYAISWLVFFQSDCRCSDIPFLIVLQVALIFSVLPKPAAGKHFFFSPGFYKVLSLP
ncbi:MAG: hypothetical protein P8X74_18830 [Reinekea sp.]